MVVAIRRYRSIDVHNVAGNTCFVENESRLEKRC